MSEFVQTRLGIQDGSLPIQGITNDLREIHGDEEEEDEQDDDTSFGLVLEERGQTGGYHTKNDRNDRFHRAVVTNNVRDFRDAIDIRGDSKVIIHGFMGSELGPEPGQTSNKPATLLVYDFTFNSTKRFRRVAFVKITFTFSTCGGPATGVESGPVVHTIAPCNSYYLGATTQTEHVENSKSANFSAGYQGASAGASQSWKCCLDGERRDAAVVYGGPESDSWGKDIRAKFTLKENASASPKSGVPSFFRLAILLERETNDEFQCTVNVEVEADWKTRMDTFFAGKTRDDPLYFNPGLPPVNKIKDLGGKIDAENLRATNLDEIFDATMNRFHKRDIKERNETDMCWI